MTALSERVVRLHRALEAGGIPHAFGGAIALAFCVSNPRATADIDVNVFVSPDAVHDVFAVLPHGVVRGANDVAVARERGQLRLAWDDTPVDLFFAYHPFHHAAKSRSRTVDFLDERLPILDCGDLVVFKALFNRPRDWVDIDAVIESGGIELDDALGRLEDLVGRDSAQYRRLAMSGAPEADEFDVYRRVFGAPRGAEEDE